MRLLIGLLLAVSCFGQTSGANVVTVLVQPTRAFSFPKTTITSSDLQNIGQNSHTMVISVGSFVGVGNLWTLDSAGIQGSSDGVNWFFIGPQTNNAAIPIATTAIVVNGYGSYPHLRVVATIGGLSTAFTGSITYTGNSAPSYVLADALQSFMQIQNTPVSVVYGSTFGVAIAPTLTSSVVVYGLHISMPATMTKITLGCADNNTSIINAGQEILIAYNDTTSRDILIPVGFRPYGSCKIGQAVLGLAVGSGAASAINVVYRVE